MHKIIAFGNPLIDVTIQIENDAILNRYNLKPDDAIELPAATIQSLCNNLKNDQKTTTAGGCAQNTLKITKWLLGAACTATIFGAVGQDENADILNDLIESAGVETRYYRHPTLPTGRSVGLISAGNRALVAHLGAAERITLDDLMNDLNLREEIRRCDLVYMEGFFVTNRSGLARFIAKKCTEAGKTFAFNVSGEYVCENEPEIVKQLAEECDVLFGNLREFKALGKLFRIEQINDLVRCLIEARPKIVVVTNGCEPITLGVFNRQINIVKINVEKIENVVDTTGGGDAFVGGFLAGFLQKKNVEECCNIGKYAAMEIIQQIGCTPPKFNPKFVF